MSEVKRLVQRSDKVAFAKVQTEYLRMHGFTTLSKKTNAKEYSRQYVDQLFETTDIVGMSASIDFNFDQFKGDKVHEMLVDIIDNEKVGTDATVTILVVDFTSPGTESGEFKAKLREFSVIPSAEGGSMDAYTYEGTFKVKSKAKDVIVTLDEAMEKATIKE